MGRRGGGGGDVEFVAKLIPTDLPDLYEPQIFFKGRRISVLKRRIASHVTSFLNKN